MSLYDMNTKQFVFAYLKEWGFLKNFLGPHNSIWSGRPSLCLVLNLKFLRKS